MNKEDYVRQESPFPAVSTLIVSSTAGFVPEPKQSAQLHADNLTLFVSFSPHLVYELAVSEVRQT